MAAAALPIFFALLAVGMPIFLVLLVVSLVLFAEEGTPLVGMAQIVADHLNSISIMAIPFFVIAATFMQRGGIAKALIDCAFVWVGWARGGLALVCVLATTFFAAISGSSVSTALAMGVILVPAMLSKNYERHFSVGVVGASGTLGILIPPSLAMIAYAIVADESVPRLFLAGIIPGLIQAAMFATWIIYYTRKNDYPKGDRVDTQQFIRMNMRAVPAMVIPVIVMGGIYGGFVTVTEAAAVAAMTAIIVALFFYRGCKITEVLGILADGVRTTASIVFIIAGALVFGHWITGSGIPRALVNFVTEQNLAAWQFLLFINLLMLVLGMFLEVLAVILITVPLVLPILTALKIDPVHYGVLLTVNMELALLTPPIGLNLYVLSSITDAPIGEVIRGTLPFIILLLFLLILVTYVPILSTYIPNLVFGAVKL